MNITEQLLTNKYARPQIRIVPKGLVIHWTANERKGADAAANRSYFNQPTTVASAHYIVDDRQIIRCVPEHEMAYHVGAKSYKQEALDKLSSYPNNCTIGIEMCVNEDGSFSEMYKKTVELAADILKRHGWTVDNLWRHFDITGKNCPAFFVSDAYAQSYCGSTAAMAWAQFKKDVHNLLTNYPQKSQGSVDICSIRLTLHDAGYLENGVSYLPVRTIAEAAGGVVEWEPESKKVSVNGVAVAAKIMDGTAYAPARELAAVVGLKVSWEGESKTVHLEKETNREAR